MDNNTLALAATIMASLSVILALIGVILALIGLWIQRKHNKLSVKPIAELIFNDYKGLLEVGIRNKGVGPLMCDEIITENDKGEIKAHLADFLDHQISPTEYFTIYTQLKDFVIAPGELLMIFSYKHDLEYHNTILNQIRQKLSKLSISVNYSNIYNDKMPLYKKSLSWFDRSKNW
jgi:hypothetical protein